MAKKIDEEQGVFQEIIDHMNAEEEKAKLRWDAARKEWADKWKAHHASFKQWITENKLAYTPESYHEFSKHHEAPSFRPVD